MKCDMSTRFCIMKRSALIAAMIVIIVSALATLTTFELLSQRNADNNCPAGFQYASMSPSPGNSTVTVAFSLEDENHNNAISDGTLVMKVVDARGQILYNTSRPIWKSDFKEYFNAEFGKNIQLYRWSINSSEIRSGVPFVNTTNSGLAVLTFIIAGGNTIELNNMSISISLLPKIHITGIDLQTNSPAQIILTPLDAFPYCCYAGDNITLSFNVSSSAPISIYNISAMGGFSYQSVTPNLPIDLSSSKTRVEINLSTPSQTLEGKLGLVFYRYDCHCTPEPYGEISLDGYVFNSTGGLYAYVRNSGLLEVTVNSTYIDGMNMQYEPVVATLGKGDTVILHIGAGILDSESHSLHIICNDGTELTADVKRT